MSKKLYKQKSAEMFNKMLTKAVEEKGKNWADLKNEFESKFPELIEQVCGDDYTPEQKQIILDYCISENIFQTIFDTIFEVGGVGIQEGLKEGIKELEEFIVKHQTKPTVDGGVSVKQQKMKDDIYNMYIGLSSLKKGKLLKGDLFDNRKRRYTNAECYNIIQSKMKLKIETSVIEEYIRKYKK